MQPDEEPVNGVVVNRRQRLWRRAGELARAPVVRRALEGSAVFALAWLYLCHVQFLSPNLSEPDAYYHIKVAWLMRSEGLLRAFPWAETSLWREAFFDKDFGFHLLLVPFTGGGLVAGAKLAAVTFGAVTLTSLYLVMRLSGVRLAWVWLLVVAGAGGYFGYRINVPRPHLLAVTLSLWTVFAVLRGSWRALVLLGAAFALCYAAPFLALGYALIGWAAQALGERRYAPHLPLAALAGIVAGSLIHPNFPNNAIALWVQNVDVLTAAWARTAVGTADELLPAPTSTFLLEHALLAVAALGAFVVAPRGRALLTPRLLTLCAVAGGTLVMACLSKRFVEYFVPFAVWALAALYSEARLTLTRRGRLVAGLVVGLLLIAGVARTHRENARNFSSLPPPRAVAAAARLRERTPPGSLLFTCDWDDTPELFFFNHHNRYLVFLDPSYLRAWRPLLWRTWRDVAEGRMPEPVGVLGDALGASGGYCTAEYQALRRQLEQNPAVELDLEPDGSYTFVLPRRPVGPRPPLR